MNAKIYNLLKQIDSYIPEKFGLSKNNRVFLKKLLNDEEFLNEQIKKHGGEDKFMAKIEEIFNMLKDIKNKKLVYKYFNEEFVQMELKKDKLIDRLVLDECKVKEMKESDKKAIGDILRKIKN